MKACFVIDFTLDTANSSSIIVHLPMYCIDQLFTLEKEKCLLGIP